MIRYVTGNILDDDAEALVNPVNCVGVMGMADPGRVSCTGGVPERKFIVHFPTRRHWPDPSGLAWIDDGLYDLIRLVGDSGIRSIALPMLGCGLGGLSWPDVLSLIKWHFSRLPDVDARVYGPNA